MSTLDEGNLKLIYSDGIIRLYSLKDSISKGRKPIVFINGQMEHRIQSFETYTECTRSSCFQYADYYTYDKNYHDPYICVYDYPIFIDHKGFYNTALFAQSLKTALQENKLGDVDILGMSVGGVIGMKASTSDRVDRVVALHSPVLSSPLADLKTIKEHIRELNLQERLIYYILKVIVDPKFGFQSESGEGHPMLEKEIKLEKIKLLGSFINEYKEVNNLERALTSLIKKVSGKNSDGVVIWDSDELRSRGFDVIEDEVPTSHFRMNKAYTRDCYDRLLK